jgi:hypothetical protein
VHVQDRLDQVLDTDALANQLRSSRNLWPRREDSPIRRPDLDAPESDPLLSITTQAA